MTSALHSAESLVKSAAVWEAMSRSWGRLSNTEKDLGWAFPINADPQAVPQSMLTSFRLDNAPFGSIAKNFLKAMQAQDRIEARRAFTLDGGHIWLWDRLCNCAPIKWLFSETVREHEMSVRAEEASVINSKRIIDSFASLDELRNRYTCWDYQYRKVLVRTVNPYIISQNDTRDQLADILIGPRDEKYHSDVRNGMCDGVVGTSDRIADALESRIARARALIAQAAVS